MTQKLLAAFIALALPFAAAASAQDVQSEVVIDLTGVRSDRGHLAFAVFPKEEGKAFPKVPQKAVLTKMVDAKKGESLISLGKLKPGVYAISLLHDENNDGKMNFHFFGMPKEGFGFSRDPRIAFGAPDFSECAVEVTGSEARVSMKAKYF
jgi:uncharacterized protein (DUF2141 family)